MFKEETKNNIIVGVEVAGVAVGALAMTAVVGGLTAVAPAAETTFKKVVTKVGITAAGLGVEYATTEMLTKAGINTLAIIDKVGDKIIENRQSKPKKEKKVRVKNKTIKEAKAFKKAKKIAKEQ